MRIKKKIRELLIWSNRIPGFSCINKHLNFFSLRIVLFFLKKNALIKQIYIRHSAATEDFEPWQSDLDLTLIIPEQTTDKDLMRLLDQYASLKNMFPLLGEAELMTERELGSWLRFGGFTAYETYNWKSIGGQGDNNNLLENKGFNTSFIEQNCCIEFANQLFGTMNSIIYAHDFINGKLFYKVFLRVLRINGINKEELYQGISMTRKCLYASLTNKDPDLYACLKRMIRPQQAFESPPIERPLAYLVNEFQTKIAALKTDRSPLLEYKLINSNKNATYEYTLNQITPFITKVRTIPEVKDIHLISGRSGNGGVIGNYNYKLYIVISDDNLHRFTQLAYQLRQFFLPYYSGWPFNYFGSCSLPILVTDSMFDFATRCWDPLEYLQINSKQQEIVSSSLIMPRTITYISSSNTFFRGLLHVSPYFVLNKDQDFGGPLTLIDYIFTLAQTHLLIFKKIIVLSPQDIVEQFAYHFHDDCPHHGWLIEFYEKYGNLSPSQMPKALEIEELIKDTGPFIRWSNSILLDHMESLK